MSYTNIKKVDIPSLFLSFLKLILFLYPLILSPLFAEEIILDRNSWMYLGKGWILTSATDPSLPAAKMDLPGNWTAAGYPIDHSVILKKEIIFRSCPEKILWIRTKEEVAAHQIFINDVPVLHSRTPGNSINESKPELLPALGYFHCEENKNLTIVWKASNFHHRRSGITGAPVIGAMNVMHDYIQYQQGRDYFFAGASLIMAFYHLGLYASRRKEFRFLLFHFLSLAIFLRIITT